VVLVTALWITILAVALASAALRAAGPMLVGGRELPSGANAVIALLVPTVLTALVVTETFGKDGRLVLDEKALGVAVAAVVLALRAPVLLAVALAVVVTALARAFG
jgi:branched-subunit amino acid transport protein